MTKYLLVALALTASAAVSGTPAFSKTAYGYTAEQYSSSSSEACRLRNVSACPH